MMTATMKPVEDRVPIDPVALRARREEKGLSFAAMAEAAQMSENNYRALEAGERDPKLSQVRGILAKLGLKWTDLPKLLRKEFRL